MMTQMVMPPRQWVFAGLRLSRLRMRDWRERRRAHRFQQRPRLPRSNAAAKIRSPGVVAALIAIVALTCLRILRSKRLSEMLMPWKTEPKKNTANHVLL